VTGKGGVSKSESAYQELRRRIIEGTYAAGHRLVLDALSREFGVSTVPIREALRRLEAEGYVRFERNIGAQVIGIDDHAYRDTMESLAYLEGIATALGAPRITSDDLEKATALNARMKASTSAFDPVGFTRLNQEFHELLCSRCPNTHMRALVHREWERMAVIRKSTFAFVPGRALESVQEHENILDLIRTGAPTYEVELATREHKLATWRSYDQWQTGHAPVITDSTA
jgi:DNA-binding GntR family transcriptional regulator